MDWVVGISRAEYAFFSLLRQCAPAHRWRNLARSQTPRRTMARQENQIPMSEPEIETVRR